MPSPPKRKANNVSKSPKCGGTSGSQTIEYGPITYDEKRNPVLTFVWNDVSKTVAEKWVTSPTYCMPQNQTQEKRNNYDNILWRMEVGKKVTGEKGIDYTVFFVYAMRQPTKKKKKPEDRDWALYAHLKFEVVPARIESGEGKEYSTRVLFSPLCSNTGYWDFCKWDVITGPKYCRNDRVTLRVTIFEHVLFSVLHSFPRPEMFANGGGQDLEFKWKQENIRLFGRSDILCGIMQKLTEVFESYRKDGRTVMDMEFNGIHPEAFRSLLYFAYSKKFVINNAINYELFYLANILDISVIKVACQEAMDAETHAIEYMEFWAWKENISISEKVQNIKTIIEDIKLLSNPRDFMNCHFSEISYPLMKLLVSMDSFPFSEDLIFTWVWQWGMQRTRPDQMLRKVIGEDVIRSVRYPLMAKAVFKRLVCPTGLLTREEIADVEGTWLGNVSQLFDTDKRCSL